MSYGTQWDAKRRLESCDDEIQFRISYKTSFLNKYVDFRARSTGNLNILPSGNGTNTGKILINLDSEPTHNLDINGNERIRLVNQDLAPDALFVGNRMNSASDLEVRRLDFPLNSNVFLNGNGQWSTIPVSNGFVPCSNLSGGQLTSDSKINLNENNFYFTDNIIGYNPQSNKIGIGYQCSDVLIGKINAKLDRSVSEKSVVGFFHNNDEASALSNPTINFIAIQALVNKPQTIINSVTHTAGRFDASGANIHYGISTNTYGGNINYGTYSRANGGQFSNYGVYGIALSNGANAQNYAGYFKSQGPNINYGIRTGASFGITNFGIFASAPSTGTNRSGYFTGIIEVGTTVYTSDQMFKQDINIENNALNILKKLNPVNYKFKSVDYPQFDFTDRLQHGFIAQEIGNILPELVYESFNPGEKDSLGNILIAPMSYKSVNYTALISLSTAAIRELNEKVEKQTLSDQSLKTNVHDLDSNSLTKILAMRGVSYSWDYTNYPEMAFDSAFHIGFIAQEINQIDSLLTFVDADGLMHVDYDKTTPIIVEAISLLNEKITSRDSLINKQQNQIIDLNERLSRLEFCLSSLLPTLCSMNQNAIQQNTTQEQQELQKKLKTIVQVTLSNMNSIILSQNVPNPFAESTVIEYLIPSKVGKAQIHFYNSYGQMINSVDISERGEGKLNVFANDLSSGIYTYSLVVDGKVVATKKMMKN